MIIIGHRGAAGIEPENTIPAIQAAVKEGVDMIEFDVQATRDGHLIVFHDDNLSRLAGVDAKISELTLKEINLTSTHSGHPIPSFHEAIEAAGKIPVLIDAKGKGWGRILVQELKKHKGPTPAVTARDHQEMFTFAQEMPHIETYVSELTRPFEGIYKARILNFTGISLNFWVLNPLAYYFAKHHNLKFMIYTVNKPFFARFLHFFYPQAAIITNVPHKLAKLSKRRTGKT